MNLGFTVENAVRARYSVRTFDSRPVEAEIREKLLDYVSALQSPLGGGMRVQFVEKETAPNGEKLGTYGIIKGAKLYLGVTIPKENYPLEALGYDFEQLVLYAASLGLGTCWLGGTFKRSAFAEAMDIRANELFPILSPVGYPAAKKRVSEALFRRTLKADARLPWEKLFFSGGFDKPLSAAEAGEWQFPLEMLRLAPSAVNKQPWRVVYDGKAFHFYEMSSVAGHGGGVDMQRIDVGIGICHFHLAALERGLSCSLRREAPQIAPAQDMHYVASCIIGE